LGHCPTLLFGYCFVFLLDHSQARDGELELDFELCLVGVRDVLQLERSGSYYEG
jgi:hypothetical protein